MIKSLNAFLHNDIPLTKKMDFQLSEMKDNRLYASAPISVNINDKGSAFGGSSSALMIISAWSLVKIKCLQANIDNDIVIHKNTTVWNKALYSDLFLQAYFKNDYNFNEILTTLKKRHQRIHCCVNLLDSKGEIYSTMKASYVIIPNKK